MARTNKTESKRKPASTKPPSSGPRKTERGKLVKIGALWMAEGKNGKFMSGRITVDGDQEIRILVFKNGYKEESKHPDYVIYEPGDDDRQGYRVTDDDIPF